MGLRLVSHYKANLMLSQIQYKTYGIPKVSKRKLEKDIFTIPGADLRELEKYAEFSGGFTRLQKVMIFLGVVLIAKNLIFPHYIINSINSLFAESSRRHSGSLKFGCLETNCTDWISI